MNSARGSRGNYLVPIGAPWPLDAAQVIPLGVLPEVDPRLAAIDLQRGNTLILAPIRADLDGPSSDISESVLAESGW